MCDFSQNLGSVWGVLSYKQNQTCIVVKIGRKEGPGRRGGGSKGRQTSKKKHTWAKDHTQVLPTLSLYLFKPKLVP